ncbi:MAG: NAD(P)H-binding protein [Polyangiales bacterium]
MTTPLRPPMPDAPSDRPATDRHPRPMRRVCIVGASGKLGRYMIQHALDRGYEVVGVCRPESVDKLAPFAGRITVIPGRTDDRAVIARAVRGADGVLVVLAPIGFQHYASGTARAVVDLAEPGARLVFSCGWHITRDGQDRYSTGFRWKVALLRLLGIVTRFADIDDQVEAGRLIFASDRDWTVVRGSDLEEGPSEGLPVWRTHIGDPALASNLTRRVDFAAFMVAALTDPALSRACPAIVGCRSPSALRQPAALTALA